MNPPPHSLLGEPYWARGEAALPLLSFTSPPSPLAGYYLRESYLKRLSYPEL